MSLTFIKAEPKIDFIGMRKICYALSILFILAGVASLLIKGGPLYGIDFAGGAVVQVKFNTAVSDEQVKNALDGVDLPGLVIQQVGADTDNEYLIRMSETKSTETLRDDLSKALAENLPQAKATIQRTEVVGPKVGADLRSQAIEALFYASLLIAIYISGRFEHRWVVAGIMAVTLAGGLYLLGQLGMPRGWLVLAATTITCLVCLRLKLSYALGAVVGLIHYCRNFDHHRLFPQRHHHCFRPYPREPEGQKVFFLCGNHQPQHQPNLEPHHPDLGHHGHCNCNTVLPGRQHHSQLRPDPAGGHCGGHLLFHLRVQPHPAQGVIPLKVPLPRTPSPPKPILLTERFSSGEIFSFMAILPRDALSIENV